MMGRGGWGHCGSCFEECQPLVSTVKSVLQGKSCAFWLPSRLFSCIGRVCCASYKQISQCVLIVSNNGDIVLENVCGIERVNLLVLNLFSFYSEQITSAVGIVKGS